MPTVNIYFNQNKPDANTFTPKVKKYLAENLSNKDIQLSTEEISVRFIQIEGDGMIGNLEMEITAHEFEERVNKQDEICRSLRDYLMREYPELKDVRVWLILSQLGHSW